MSLTTDIATRLQPARSELLAGVPGVAHGVSHRVAGLGRADGNIGLGSPRDKADAWAMRQAYGTRPERLLAWLGPALGPCCHETGPEVTAAWRDTAGAFGIDPEPAISRPGPKDHFHVPEANRRLLLASGLSDEHIDISPECTKCDTDRWFSHRGHGPGAGREGAFIAIVPRSGSQ